MHRTVFACLNLLAASLGSIACGQSPEGDRPCRLERADRAIAACLGRQAEERETSMEAHIAETLSGLQAARAGELRVLGIRYREAQAAWRDAVRTGCDALGDPVAIAACRLDAAMEREAELDESLARATADLGGAGEAGVYIGREAEVLVPLRLPGPADGLISDLPILIPLLP
jgi:hypothetical protein